MEATPPVLAQHTQEPMNPASVMKLVTGFAALDRLGPAFAWKTRFVSRGDIRQHALHGDLHIVGGGDPRLSRERLWLALRDLRAQGVRRIDGDVVADRSLFRLPPHDPGLFDQRPLRPYNAGADALKVDYGAIRLRVQPTPAGAGVSSEPLPVGLAIDNRLRRSPAAGCGDPTAQLVASRTETPAGVRLVLEGALPQGCTKAFDWNLAPLPPAFEAGILILATGVVSAATISFLIHARLVGNRLPELFAGHPKAEAVFNALVRNNARRTTLIIFLLRLSPAMPFALTNFLMASARVPVKSFIVGTFFGMLPRSSAVVFFGAGLSELSFTDPQEAWLIVFGIVATIISVAFVSYVAKKALARVTTPVSSDQPAIISP